MSAWQSFYEGGFYPDAWPTSWVPRHFPEHHYPFEHARHSVSHLLNDFGHEIADSASSHGMITPRVDCRESRANYYFDIELPGLDNTQNLTIRWIALRTLLVKAVVKRRPTAEDEEEKSKGESAQEEHTADGDKKAEKPKTEHTADGDKKAAKPKTEHKVFLTMSERRIGLYGRAFNFSVDVDHDKTVAKLEAGILRMTVPKLEEEKKVDKKVEVENHAESTDVK